MSDVIRASKIEAPREAGVHLAIFVEPFLQFVLDVGLEAGDFNHQIVATLRYAALLAVIVYVSCCFISEFLIGHPLYHIDEAISFLQPPIFFVENFFKFDVIDQLFLLLLNQFVQLIDGLEL